VALGLALGGLGLASGGFRWLQVALGLALGGLGLASGGFGWLEAASGGSRIFQPWRAGFLSEKNWDQPSPTFTNLHQPSPT